MSKLVIYATGILLLISSARAQMPPPVIPHGVGVNIHFVTGNEKDLDLIAAGGFKFIRMDFSWEETEPKAGAYDWSSYDELSEHLARRGLRAIFILDYVNSAYEPMVEARRAVGEPSPEQHIASPRHPESVAAFARWAAAAARHFRGRGVIWEIYNEPNGGFWRPKPDAAEYSTMALATAKALKEAEPDATLIAPALSAFDFKFLEPFLASGVLEYLDGVSVHPYRQPTKPPETAARGFKEIREMINRYAPESRRGKIAIISGEWGYSSNRKGVSLETQADFAVRQQLANLLNGVPLSIWYDWKNDGADPDYNEDNFGVVYSDLRPKPAYNAVREMTRALDGFEFKERVDGFGPKDYVLLFAKPDGTKKIAAWTLLEPHTIMIERWKPGVSLELRSRPQYVSVK
ncbi:MAG TPA: cellulase family glycosylhydrolase [Verrucomicrobiae bacterium]|nr:cellulase family glycosylhydrolase [Verrucomicrobiae bacterium]